MRLRHHAPLAGTLVAYLGCGIYRIFHHPGEPCAGSHLPHLFQIQAAGKCHPHREAARAFAAGRHATEVVCFSARIEREIAELDAADAGLFRKDLGIAEPALDRMIRASYRLLGRVSFFTVGDDECRAWTIRRGTAARQAAGAVHSDIERGFIRAELVAYDDLEAAGSWAACRERGTLRLEGKDYVVRDGDVINFRFGV